MIKQIRKILLIAALAATSFIANANGVYDVPEGSDLKEVHVLSLQFEGNGRASLVARPCDTNVECDDILARISKKTIWRDGHQVIDYQQARRLKWEGAVLVVDKFNNALFVERILMGGES